MVVHAFEDGNKPAMVLIHGVLTPWQVWTPQIEVFKEHYNIYSVALNAHTENSESEFVSVSDEAEEITEYLLERKITAIEVLCGMSLGGKIAYEIWKQGKLGIQNLILDGAPLAACPKFAVNMMIRSYKDIVHKSKSRDRQTVETFKKYFLPERYLDSYLRIADRISDESLENMVNTAFSGEDFTTFGDPCRILFIHGTKANEILSQISAKRLKKRYQETQIIRFRGDPHCYKAIYQPDEWCAAVKDFLELA